MYFVTSLCIHVKGVLNNKFVAWVGGMMASGSACLYRALLCGEGGRQGATHNMRTGGQRGAR